MNTSTQQKANEIIEKCIKAIDKEIQSYKQTAERYETYGNPKSVRWGKYYASTEEAKAYVVNQLKAMDAEKVIRFEDKAIVLSRDLFTKKVETIANKSI